jgi:hypothetical protein
LQHHPGLLGVTSQGVIAIHADWPMYPWEHGWMTALINLSCFPAGTTFTEIDDIDQVLLLDAEKLAPHDAGDDPFSPKRFHAAIWHEDLVELARLGYVTGVEPITDDVHRLNRHLEVLRAAERHEGKRAGESNVPGPYTTWPTTGLPELPKIGALRTDGTFIEIPPPTREWDDEDDDISWPQPTGWVLLPDKTLTVTAAGAEACDKALAEHFEVPETLRARLQPILDAGLYETAIRETSVQLEIAMRDGIGERGKSGQELIERYVKHIERSAGVMSSGIKSLRGDLRLTFRFVRNAYAHENPNPPRVRASALLFRLCNLYEEVTELTPARDGDTT